MENNLDKIYSVLCKGLESDPLNVNLLYVMAGLYEIQGKLINAYVLYKKIGCISKDEMLSAVKLKIAKYENLKKIEDYKRRKKVLIIAYIFPPIGGSGVQRTLKFVKYLRKFNYEPIVVTVLYCEFMPKDNTLLCEIPDDIQIVRIKEASADERYYKDFVDFYAGIVKDDRLTEQYEFQLLKLQNNFKRLAFVTDINVTWAMEVVDKIGDIIDFDGIDLIYSTSGPYSDHIAGYYLKKKYRKPWISDFRDEWTNNPYFDLDRKSILYKMQRKMEDNILKYSDKVLTVSEISSENYINEFHLPENKVMTITNGYDEDDFESVEGYDKKRNDKFTIIFNGSLYFEIDPSCFIISVNQLIEEKKIPKEKISVEIVGEVERYILDKIVSIDIYGIIKILSYMPHVNSLKNASRADLLLLIIGGSTRLKSVYTGKVFEYLRLCRHIISLSPRNSLVEKLILETRRGRNFEISDTDGIKEYVLKSFENWESGGRESLEVTDKIKKYGRKHLTDILTNTFDEVIFNFPEDNFHFEEKRSSFYDLLYRNGGLNETYFEHYSRTRYFPVWSRSMEIIRKIKDASIIDIGCGAGQFANLVFDNGIVKYRGIDFSSEAIKIARIRNDKYRNLFKADDAYTSDIIKEDYNTVVLFEVLEHLNRDLELIWKLRSGSNIIFSVPNFYFKGHVRWFNSRLDILKRYSTVVDIYNIYTFNIGRNSKIYLVWGVRKGS